MTTTEIKKRVISKINRATDNELLMDIYKLLNPVFKDNEVYRLSDHHKLAIHTAIKQIADGEYLTNEQAQNDIKEWLKK